MITDSQRQFTRDNNIRIYYADSASSPPNALHVASFVAPVDMLVSNFDDIDACIAAVADATQAWINENQ